jgi:hypothetical protein
MGQQQLVLITLCAILTGIAIAVGISIFVSSDVVASRDAMIQDMTIIAESARKYYIKPTSSGGGNYSYIGYKMPPRLKRTDNGAYEAKVEDKLRVRFNGISEQDPANTITVLLGYYRDPLYSWDYGGDFDMDE